MNTPTTFSPSISLPVPHLLAPVPHLLAYDDALAAIWTQPLGGRVVVTANACPEYLLQLLTLREARGLVWFDGSLARLWAAVELVCTGDSSYFGPALHSPLTLPEREVLHGVGLGQSNKTLGRVLGRSEYTVRNQLASVRHKLNLQSRADLKLYYLGWLDVPGLDRAV